MILRDYDRFPLETACEDRFGFARHERLECTKPMGSERGIELIEGDTRLYDRYLVFTIDVEDPVHAA